MTVANHTEQAFTGVAYSVRGFVYYYHGGEQGRGQAGMALEQ